MSQEFLVHDGALLELCNEERIDLPLGAIVATCTLADVVPIVADGWPANEAWRPALVVDDDGLTLYRTTDDEASSIVDDELPYGDFTPGRFAWLLEDVKPTTERCPACWGSGSYPRITRQVCHVCDAHLRCDPVPAHGRQRLWEWTP